MRARRPATSRSTRARGDAAEAAACRWLQAQGLTVLARNVGFRHGELDLVLEDGAMVVVVEVRLRREGAMVDAALSVDRHKQRRVARSAALFLAQRPPLAVRPMRFDVVAVTDHGDEQYAFEWIRGAFGLEDGSDL